MPIEPIKRNSIGNEIYSQMKQMIVDGEWKPGSRIPSENELRQMFGVSRISIRGALQKLLAYGIIETRHGDGTYVKEPSGDIYMNSLIPMLVLRETDMDKVLEFRKIIEVESARIAAERVSDEEAGHLKAILEKMRQHKDDYLKYSEDDLDFHFEIAKITKNPLIVKVNLILKDILISYMQTIVASLGYTGGLYYHEKLLEAIEGRNPDLAKKYMEEHIDTTISSMTKTNPKPKTNPKSKEDK